MTDEEKDSGHVWLIKKLREAWEERDQHKKAEEIHVKVRLKLQAENEKLEGRVLELVEENTKLMEEVVELEAELENKGGLSASEELEVLERLEKLEAALEGR